MLKTPSQAYQNRRAYQSFLAKELLSDVSKQIPGRVTATYRALVTPILGMLFGCSLRLAMCRLLLLLLGVEFLNDVLEDVHERPQDLLLAIVVRPHSRFPDPTAQLLDGLIVAPFANRSLRIGRGSHRGSNGSLPLARQISANVHLAGPIDDSAYLIGNGVLGLEVRNEHRLRPPHRGCGVQTHLVHHDEDSLEDGLLVDSVEVVVLIYNAELAEVDLGWTEPVLRRGLEVLEAGSWTTA
jgi:hypothetical protein